VKLRVLVVDDEPLARERLSHLVEEMADAELAGVAASGEQALMLAGTLRPEVVLLDIRMPGMDGLEAARHLARMPHPPAVIFTTAFDEHALAAFEVQAAGYVLKPVRQEKLVEAIARARQPNRAQLTRIADGAGGGPRTRIAVRTRDQLKLIPVENIICFTAELKYTTLRHAGGDELIEEPLKALENEFAGSFLRIHRNSLVALAHVEGLEKDAEGRQVLRLRSGAGTLAVSRRLAAEVARKLKE